MLNNQTKICTRCHTDKALSEFYFNNYKQKHKSECKACEAIRGKEYYKKNTEKVAVRGKEWRENNKERKAATNKEWNIANAERISIQKKQYNALNKEKNVARGKAYRQTPMGKAVNKNSKHKRRTIERKGDVTTQQLLELQQNAKGCYWCECSLKNKAVHIDHYVALSRGGEHTLSNLVVACATCNIQKHAKDPIYFAESFGKLF